MWISNRRHVYRVCGIRLHPIGVFSNVLMQNKRHEHRKTSDWSKSYCSLHGRYRQRYIRVRVRFFNKFVINVDIEPWSRHPWWRHHITSEWRVFECVDAKEATWYSENIWFVKKWLFPTWHMQTAVSCLLCMKAIEVKLCRVVYGVRQHRLTRFEMGTVRNTEVIADRTIWNKWTCGNYSLFP